MDFPNAVSADDQSYVLQKLIQPENLDFVEWYVILGY